MATKLTGKQLTKVSKKDLAEAIDDGNGAFFSPDGKRLIKFTNKNLTKYAVNEGTEIIADEAFLCMKNLKEITIPNTVTYIGKSAFVSLRSIKKIVLPDSVKYLGEMAFMDCISLKEIVLPDTLTHIGGMAFDSCRSLKKVMIPKRLKTLESAAFSGCLQIEIASNSKRFIIKNDFLIDNKNKAPLYYFGKDKKVVMPKGITRIDWPVFIGSQVEEITVSDSVTTLGYRAFNDCPELQIVILPATITEIVGVTFTMCKSLKEVCVPKQCKEAYLKMIYESLAVTPHIIAFKIPQMALSILKPTEFSIPESYMSKILTVKYWELLVEI